MPSITLPNGIILDDSDGMAPTLQAHALRRGLSQMRVFVATHPSGVQNYLLVEGEVPIWESQSSEAIWTKIEMLHLAEKLQ